MEFNNLRNVHLLVIQFFSIEEEILETRRVSKFKCI